MDYQITIHPTAETVETSKAELGIICGSGNGGTLNDRKQTSRYSGCIVLE
jgi:purine nucleoside phosphorylase